LDKVVRMSQSTASTSEDHLKFLRRLRAVREYTAEPVSQDAIEQILEVGRWTSTGGNRQPTEVVVVRDPEVKRMFGVGGARPAATADVVLLLATANQNVLDEGRMAERLALGARACGLGSVIATLKNEGPDEAKKLLGIPDERRSTVVVAIGHTDVEARRALPKSPQPRKPMTEFAHWDRF
jgi:nitroreductase